MERASYAETDYRKALNIEDLARIARRRLSHCVYEYLEGGADAERTLNRNRRVFDDHQFEPKTLTRVGLSDLSTTLLGRQHALPLVIGPPATTAC